MSVYLNMSSCDESRCIKSELIYSSEEVPDRVSKVQLARIYKSFTLYLLTSTSCKIYVTSNHT